MIFVQDLNYKIYIHILEEKLEPFTLIENTFKKCGNMD